MKIGIDEEDSSATILLVEDSALEREIIVEVLASLYPLAKVRAPINLFSEDVKKLISEGQFTSILLDSNLSGFGAHPEFGEWGENLIPFIRLVSKQSTIVAIASKDDDNEIMVAKGAKMAINKRRFHDERYGREATIAMLNPV